MVAPGLVPRHVPSEGYRAVGRREVLSDPALQSPGGTTHRLLTVRKVSVAQQPILEISKTLHQRQVHWVPPTTSNFIHQIVLVISGTFCIQTSNIDVNQMFSLLREKSARYSRVLVVTELIVSRTQCNFFCSKNEQRL